MSDWLSLRADWPWRAVSDLQTKGHLLVEDGNHGEYRPRPAEFTDEGTSFIRAADLVDGRPSFTSAGRINDSAFARIRKGIGAPGDILFSHKGTVGKVAKAPIDAPPYVCSPQTTFWRVRTPEIIDREFLYVYMRSPEFIRQWTVRKGDTDMADYVSLTAQRTLLVPVPPLPVQRKIAAIVSAYDDVIENNNRRIKIVEEMAQRIYREWFVEFRYPGHEGTELVGSDLGPMPVGWATRTLEEVCTRITDGAHASPPSTEAGLPMASVKDMTDSGLDLGGCRRISIDDYEALRRQGCQPLTGDVLISKDGAKYLDKVFSVHGDEDVVLLSSIAILRPNSAIESSVLAAILKDAEVKRRLKGHVSGAAIPRVVLKDFKIFRIVVPPVVLQQRFDRCVGAMRRMASVLECASREARRNRDLLLPRLISGDINVDDLDIALPDPA